MSQEQLLAELYIAFAPVRKDVLDEAVARGKAHIRRIHGILMENDWDLNKAFPVAKPHRTRRRVYYYPTRQDRGLAEFVCAWDTSKPPAVTIDGPMVVVPDDNKEQDYIAFCMATAAGQLDVQIFKLWHSSRKIPKVTKFSVSKVHSDEKKAQYALEVTHETKGGPKIMTLLSTANFGISKTGKLVATWQIQGLSPRFADEQTGEGND